MYTIKCDGFPLLDIRDDDFMLINPKVTVETNTVGSGSFTIYKNHPNFDKLQRLKSVFEVRDEIGVIFRGRMTNDSIDFDNGKAVDLEGSMAYFNDSIVRPYDFPNDFVNDAEYNAAAQNGNVVEFFLKWLIDNHNSQVQAFQQFKLGNVTVSDTNNNITRSDTNYTKTWDVLKSKLFDSALGGFLCIRYEDDGNYIDYLADFGLYNTQDIVFGENLLDMKRDMDASTTYTACIPIGAEVEIESEDGTKTKKKITLADFPDCDITDDVVKNGDTLYSKKAVDNYGWIYAPVADTTSDDITDVNNLLTKYTAYISGTAPTLAETIETTAADLHFSDAEIRSFRIYRKQNVYSLPHDVTATYNLTKLAIDLLNPQNTKITVGETKLTLTDINKKQETDTIVRIESAEKDIEANRNEVTIVDNRVSTQSTELVNTCSEIVMGVMKAYVETSNYDEFKQTLESKLSVEAEKISAQIKEITSYAEGVNGDVQKNYEEIVKFFEFNIDGLVIKQGDSPYKIKIDNDRFSMYFNEVEVLWFDGNGKGHIPELNITRLMDLFGYSIQQDGDLVNCVYLGGDE